MSAIFSIQQESLYECRILPFTGKFKVDLKESLREKLDWKKGKVEVEKEVALKALKDIAMSSKIKSFISKPEVVILTGIVLLTIGTTLGALAPLASVALAVALKVFAILFGMTGGGLTGFVIGDLFGNQVLRKISQEFSAQQKDANRLISEIEKCEDQKIVLDLSIN